VEREEGDRRRSGEVEMEDGGQLAALESAVTVERGIGIRGEWGLGNDLSKKIADFFYQAADRRRHPG
jgi:hypothetical protein